MTVQNITNLHWICNVRTLHILWSFTETVLCKYETHKLSIQLLDSGIFSFVKLHPQEVLADNDKNMVTEYQC